MKRFLVLAALLGGVAGCAAPPVPNAALPCDREPGAAACAASQHSTRSAPPIAAMPGEGPALREIATPHMGRFVATVALTVF
ncbi:MAG: hypothetical protein D6686_15890 [Alphaproteobacteria bacterium]|nr:MAG: hypothetical protein D6686_15890 [Alphaproteobacteria bacterium]